MELTPHFAITATLDDTAPNYAMPHRAYKFTVEARFGVDQWADDERAIPTLRERAVRVVLREIYGPVEERLHEILVMRYEAGPIYEDKVLQAVETLLKDLRP